MFTDFGERERGSGSGGRNMRNVDRRRNIDPLPPYTSWLGIKPATFWCMGQHSFPLAERAQLFYFLKQPFLGTAIMSTSLVKNLRPGEEKQIFQGYISNKCQIQKLNMSGSDSTGYHDTPLHNASVQDCCWWHPQPLPSCAAQCGSLSIWSCWGLRKLNQITLH